MPTLPAQDTDCDSAKDNSDNFIPSSMAWLWLAILGVFALWWLSQYAFFVRPHFAPNKPGEFGDSFGGINALFSGLAFLGVIFAVYLQRQDLRLQMKELAETQEILKAQQEEVKAQRQQAELQTRTFIQQTFENTFFQLLRFRQEIITELVNYRQPNDGTRGAACFRAFELRLDEFFSWARRIPNLQPPSQKPASSVVVSEFYPQFWVEIRPHLESLHKITTAILVLIAHTSEIPKETYVDILRSCISSAESKLLFYHALYLLGQDGNSITPTLIRELNLLSDLRESSLIDRSHVEWGAPLNLWNLKTN